MAKQDGVRELRREGRRRDGRDGLHTWGAVFEARDHRWQQLYGGTKATEAKRFMEL